MNVDAFFVLGYCLSHELGEIVVAVKMPLTRAP